MTTRAPYTSILTATGGNGNLQIVGLDANGCVRPIAQQLRSGWTAVTAGPFSAGVAITAIAGIAAPPHDGAFQVVGPSTYGDPYLACWQGNDGNWNGGRSLPTLRAQYQSLAVGVGGVDGGGNTCLQVIGLGADGNPSLAGWLGGNNPWNGGMSLPNVGSKTYQSLVTGVGISSYLHVFGLGTDGKPYLVCWLSDTWNGYGALPNVGSTTYQSLVTAVLGVSPRSYLHVFGLGTDGNAYLPCYQDPSSGNWLQGQPLASPKGTPFAQLVAATAGDGTLQVIGLGKNDSAPYVAAYRDSAGKWQPGSEFYEGDKSFSMLAMGPGVDGTLQLVGQNRADGSPVVIGVYTPGARWQSQDIPFD